MFLYLITSGGFLFFYLACFSAIFFACCIIIVEKTIHAVFSLIFLFFSIFAILLSLGSVEFLAAIVLIVYIGAVAILFLFTIMIIGSSDVNKKDSRTSTIDQSLFSEAQELRIKIFILVYVFIYKVVNSKAVSEAFDLIHLSTGTNNRDFETLTNVYSNDINNFNLLYTEYYEIFFVITFILFITLVGTLFLCKAAQKSQKLTKN